eukprot:CAMPEP_0173181832 /NCGR_PEP_ID=MMETSP1141-20130122/7502_1 /TAXON_ID=483371 /ORGANISM="non described non described, Strain CCMP2298" /LENGTH=122 /DNA_ID=CAMNT_0014104861 /DNA_START=69 /DNA_END=437 /DNA_ORIENTATION=+
MHVRDPANLLQLLLLPRRQLQQGIDELRRVELRQRRRSECMPASELTVHQLPCHFLHLSAHHGGGPAAWRVRVAGWKLQSVAAPLQRERSHGLREGVGCLRGLQLPAELRLEDATIPQQAVR